MPLMVFIPADEAQLGRWGLCEPEGKERPVARQWAHLSGLFQASWPVGGTEPWAPCEMVSRLPPVFPALHFQQPLFPRQQQGEGELGLWARRVGSWITNGRE